MFDRSTNLDKLKVIVHLCVGISVNTGLLVLRLVLGLLLVGHGSQKLFGLFGGPGLAGTGGFFHSIGFRPGRPMAIVAGTTEAAAGLSIGVGLLTPLASAAVIGTLVAAGSVHWAAGIWAQNGGFELPLVYITAATALAFTGPGAYSLDNALGLDGWAAGWGVAAVIVGAVSGLTVVARARRALAADAVALAAQEKESVPA
jgi:putative oxidoreductase